MPDQLDEAALEFARYCLKQSDSFIDEGAHQLHVRPDGYGTGPESFADCESLDYEDLRLVLPLVAYWCSLNSVLLEIMCTDPVDYQCRFTQRYGGSVGHIIETGGSGDLCRELLDGAAYLAQQIKEVNPPRPSMSWSQWVEGHHSK